MTINLTSEFFKNNGLVRRNDLAELKGTRLAIDGHFWIRNLQFNEPYQMAMGGVPLSVHSGIDDAIEKLNKYDIKPLFVFNGIKLPPAPPMNSDGKSINSGVQGFGVEQYRRREEAWRHYQKNDYEGAKNEFKEAGSGSASGDLLDAVLKYFQQRNIEFLRAPYLAWAQCAWFCGQKDRVASAVWGSEEILLFIGMVQFDKLILQLDFNKGIYEWVSLAEICEALVQGTGGKLTVSQFIDCCILVGFRGGWIKGVGPFNDGNGFDSTIEFNSIRGGIGMDQQSKECQLLEMSFRDISRVAKDLISTRTGPSLLELKVRQFHLNDTPYFLDQALEQFLRIKNLIIHHIVLNLDCLPIPISMHNSTNHDADRNYYGNKCTESQPWIANSIIPNNLHTIIGPRLPNLVYFFLSIGLVSPQVLFNVVQNMMIDYCPSIDFSAYRDLLQKIVPLRTQIAFLLINCNSIMNKDEIYWRVVSQGGRRPAMVYLRWHNEKTIALHTPPALLLDDWEVDREVAKSHPAVNFVSALSFAHCAAKNLKRVKDVRAASSACVHNEVNEVGFVTLLKSLDLLGYFTHPPQQKPLGNDESGLSLFAQALGTVDHRYAEQGVLFIELLRTRALNCEPFQPCKPSNDSDAVAITLDVNPSWLLISRVFSILPMKLKTEEWGSDVVVRDLTAFHILFASLKKTLRTLCEVIMMTMFLDGHVKYQNESLNYFRDVGNLLPFRDSSNTAMGVVVHQLLRECHDSKQKNVPWEKLQMEKTFPCCADIRGDLAGAYRFWKQACGIAERLEKSSTIPTPLHRRFKEADQLLCNTMEAVGIEPAPS